MINQEILTYIETELAKGTSRDIVQSSLLSNGWNEKDVVEAFLMFSQKNKSETGISSSENNDKKLLLSVNENLKVIEDLIIFMFVCALLVLNPIGLFIVGYGGAKIFLGIALVIFIVAKIISRFFTSKVLTVETNNNAIAAAERNIKTLKSIWFWWFIIYLTDYLVMFSASFWGDASFTSLINKVLAFFIPFDLFGFISSTQLFLSPANIVYIIFFVVTAIFSDKILNKKNYSINKRILLNLSVLLIVSTLISIFRGASTIIFMKF